jgi:hypothetical protein
MRTQTQTRIVIAVAVTAMAAVALSACFTDPDPGPAPEETATEALRTFSGCVQTPDLEAADFAARWSPLTTTTGQCAECHSTADAGGYEPIDPDNVAATIQIAGSLIQIQVFFTTTPDENDIVVNSHHFEATAGGGDEHPRYDLDDHSTLEALEQVYSEAHARFTAGECDEPRF